MISRILLWGSWLVFPLFHVPYAIHQESFHLQNITWAQITRITQPSHVMEMTVTSNLLVLTLERCNLFLSGNLLKNWHQFLTPLFFKNPIISHFTQNENSTVLSGLIVPTWLRQHRLPLSSNSAAFSCSKGHFLCGGQAFCVWSAPLPKVFKALLGCFLLKFEKPVQNCSVISVLLIGSFPQSIGFYFHSHKGDTRR